jgi:hypothetical protein
MTTALQMITRGMRIAQVLQKGESLDNDEAQDGLYAMNSMLDSWSIDRLYVYQILDEAFTLTVGTTSYTIGSGGVFNTTRPSKLDNSCFLRLGSLDYPVTLIDNQAYASILDKTITGLPTMIYYEPAYPLGTIYFNRKPDQAYSFHCKSWKQLQQFTALTDTLSLPPGYQEAIEWSFAERYGLEYNDSIPAQVKEIAAQARRLISSVNSPDSIMQIEAANRRRYTMNIYTG